MGILRKVRWAAGNRRREGQSIGELWNRFLAGSPTSGRRDGFAFC